MIKYSLWFPIFLLLMVLSPCKLVNGQTFGEIPESTLLSDYFDVVYGPDERLVTGPFYYGATKGSIIGHPYYSDDTWKSGAIEIGTVRFEELQLKYDVVLNQVVLKYETAESATFQVGLRSGNITKLYLDQKTFIPFPDVKDSVMVPFAQLMTDGDIRYLLVRHKYLALTNGAGLADYLYKESLKQYLYIDDRVFLFRGKAQLFKLYPALKPELKQFIRREKIFLGRNKIEERARLIEQCNLLLNSTNE